MNRTIRQILPLLPILLVVACSGAPPEIADVELIRIYVSDPKSQTVSRQLGIFVSVSDPDGFDDLSRLYLIHDQAELYWALDPTNWQQATVRGQEWVGSYGLALPVSEQAPPGEYRVLIEDLSGESAETTRVLPAVPTRLPPFPEVAPGAADDREIQVWSYDHQGILIGSIPLSVMDTAQWEATGEYYLYRRLGDQPLAVATGPISP